MTTTTKKDLARTIAATCELTIRDVTNVIDALLDAIANEVASGAVVTLAGHGNYKPAARAARTARNPINGDTIHVPAKTVPTFTPAQAFKDRVNGA